MYLKCDLMVFKSGPDFSRDRTYTGPGSRKRKFQLDLNFWPGDCRPDTLLALYCSVIKLLNYFFVVVAMNFGTLLLHPNNFNL